MPKRITNPIREGLPSKIYLLAYGKPITGYEIARRIQGIKTPGSGERAITPQTGKIYGWLKKLMDDGYVIKKENGYLSKAEPLLKEIEEALNGDIDDSEKDVLLKLLNSEIFRSHIEKNLPDSFEYPVDCVTEIFFRLSIMAAYLLPVKGWSGKEPPIGISPAFISLRLAVFIEREFSRELLVKLIKLHTVGYIVTQIVKGYTNFILSRIEIPTRCDNRR